MHFKKDSRLWGGGANFLTGDERSDSAVEHTINKKHKQHKNIDFKNLSNPVIFILIPFFNNTLT
jgi:hypothetical protein